MLSPNIPKIKISYLQGREGRWRGLDVLGGHDSFPLTILSDSETALSRLAGTSASGDHKYLRLLKVHDQDQLNIF